MYAGKFYGSMVHKNKQDKHAAVQYGKINRVISCASGCELLTLARLVRFGLRVTFL